MLGLKLWVVAALVAVMLVLRWRRVGTLTWMLAWWLVLWAGIKFAFVVPVPASVLKLYMGILTLSLFAYVTSSDKRRKEFWRPIVTLITDPARRLLLAAAVLR